MTVLKKTPTNYYILASITSLFILNGVKLIGKWISFIEIMSTNAGQNSLATSYLFVVYGTSLGEGISVICGYPITVIADALMVNRLITSQSTDQAQSTDRYLDMAML